MVYTKRARHMRQCKHIIERTGKRCKRWATYGTPDQKCIHHRAEPGQPAKQNSTRTEPCDCQAYPFPHRRSGGLCRWPEKPFGKWNGWQGKNSITSRERNRAIRDNPELYEAAVRYQEKLKNQEKK